MSWMDSWSRPGKSQATPAPFYLLPGGESTPYCRSCGRVISSRRTNIAAGHDSNAPSYCSQRCRNSKPRKLDQEIEATFVRILSGKNGDDASQAQRGNKSKKRVVKGDPRVIASCGQVEKAMFGDHADPDKTFGRKKNRASRVLPSTSDDGREEDVTTEAPEDRDSAVDLGDNEDDLSRWRRPSAHGGTKRDSDSPSANRVAGQRQRRRGKGTSGTKRGDERKCGTEAGRAAESPAARNGP